MFWGSKKETVVEPKKEEKESTELKKEEQTESKDGKDEKKIVTSISWPPIPSEVIPFRQKYNLEKRLADSAAILAKYSNRVPIVVERSKKTDANMPYLDKPKYLVPRDMAFSQFCYVVRKRLKLKEGQAFLLFCGHKEEVLPVQTITVMELYQEFKDPDGFLYMTYMGENAFGQL